MTDFLADLRDTLRYLLASQYSRRYQEIVMRIPPQILFHPQPLEQKYWEGNQPVASAIHAYIDLCAEELRMYKAGQIPEEIWENWDEGIRAGMKLPAIASLWNNYFTKGPYKELRSFLEKTK